VQWDLQQAVHEGAFTKLENTHNTITTENRTHIDINYFDHKDLGNHVLQKSQRVMNQPVDE